jgi:hypothetical protein
MGPDVRQVTEVTLTVQFRSLFGNASDVDVLGETMKGINRLSSSNEKCGVKPTLTTATQQDTTGIIRSKVRDPLGPTAVKNAKRSAETAVASTVSPLSP